MEEDPKKIQQNITGDYHATSVYGDASLHVHPPPVPSMPPERVWMVPYRRNTFFTGRDGLLRELHVHFTRDRATVLTQGQAINGLGGIGKTQIAVEYAYRHQDEYRFVLWASAASKETLLAAYVNMADRLQLPERNAQEQDKIVTAVLHWLATHEGWLLIVDNADEVDMVWRMLPAGNTGHLLLTTRDQVVGGMERFLVDPMDRVEGTLLLLHRAHMMKAEMGLEQIALADRDVAEQIVAEVDGLPLALDQAGAYIEEVACSLKDYLEMYRQRRSTFLADRGRLTSDHPAPVATTWILSFERVEQRNPAAADLLRVCAFLAPDAIPEELLIKGAIHLGPHLQPMETDPSLLREMIRTLRAYSLIRRDSQEKILSIHRLVQAVVQDALADQERLLWQQRVIQALNAAFPIVTYEAWSLCERLFPHVLACISAVPDHTNERELAFVLERAGNYRRERALYDGVELLYQRALRIWEQSIGSEHLHIASLLNNLANLYYAQGRFEEAEPLYQQAVKIWEQTVGLEHPDVALPLNNLASLYYEQGMYTQAELLYQRALQIREQSLGLEHLAVASSLNNLANLYREQGKYVLAKPLYQRALKIYERVGKIEHFQSTHPLHNLAIIHYEQGEYKEAELLYLQALTIRERILGLDHPEVAASLIGLANLYKDQGRYENVESLYQRALNIYEQTLGSDHSQVAYALIGLGNLYHVQGKYEKAERMYHQALRIREQTLGSGHSQVAYALTGLGIIYYEQGKYKEAEPLYQRALRIREQTVGPEHPDVATPLTGLGIIYYEQGKYKEAEPLYQRALRVREQTVGPEHPDVAYLLNNLANLYKDQGEFAKAELLYQRALYIWEQKLGPEHPQVTYPLNNLANLYSEQSKYTQAEPLYQRAIRILEQTLGPQHPQTAETIYHLARFHEAQENGEEASVWYVRALTIREQALGIHHSKTRETRARLIALLHMLGKYEEAAQFDVVQSES